MKSKLRFDKTEFISGLIVGSAAGIIVVSFMLSLGAYASKPAAHPASYAVLNSSPLHFSPAPSDQEGATFASLSGIAPGHSYVEYIDE